MPVRLPGYRLSDRASASCGKRSSRNLFRWRVCFQGPENTPFEGGLYEATLRFPEEFPYQPPKMVFKTEMFHPNSNVFMM